jgi:hypothetical protein
VLKLADEFTDRPELKDFRLLMSGVVLEDEGVDVLRGIMEGERDVDRVSGCGGAFAICVKL